MVTVTSSELGDRFIQLGDVALSQPVSVIHRDRPSLVLLSNEEYERLRALDTRRAYYAHELPDDLKEALASAEPAPECAEFNGEDRLPA